MGAAVDGDDGVGIAEHAGNLLVQVVQGVAVLGEDDELAQAAAGIAHGGIVLQDAGEFVPFAVLPGGDNGLGLMFESLEDDNLLLQLGDGAGGGGLIDQRFFEILLFLGVEVVVVLGHIGERLGEDVLAADAELFLAQAAFEAFLAALERLEDGLGAGSEAALEGGEGEADGAFAFAVELRRPCPFPSSRSA